MPLPQTVDMIEIDLRSKEMIDPLMLFTSILKSELPSAFRSRDALLPGEAVNGMFPTLPETAAPLTDVIVTV